ncbi:L-idonate 5-dehydrogenase, partial [Cohaesibacter celericrescens]
MKSVVCYGPKDIRVEETELAAVGATDVLVKVEAGGICGSDLHYYHQGGFGAVRIQQPMILGHEIAGTVIETGSEVSNVSPGDLVAVSPSVPCGECEYCRKAMFNHCLDMRFYGSAMRMPHVQGAFSEKIVAKSTQCHAFPKGTSPFEAACAEPFSVGLHAVKRAGSLIGKRVLVTGAGPIGALVVAAAKIHGAIEIVATDVVDEALEKVLLLGADKVINVATNADGLKVYEAGKGYFDVVIECSGNQSAMISALAVIRPGGRMVQLGLGGDVTLPQNVIVAKEIEMCGSFRFHEEFAWAVELIGSKRVPLEPLLTGVFPMEDAV